MRWVQPPQAAEHHQPLAPCPQWDGEGNWEGPNMRWEVPEVKAVYQGQQKQENATQLCCCKEPFSVMVTHRIVIAIFFFFFSLKE